MKNLKLSLLRSKIVIWTTRLLSFTCVLRCHTSSPKGKCRNLLIYNSVAEMYFPACWLANANIHRLIKPGHLPTPTLPKRISIFFLWEEFSWRAPTEIVNPLQYTVCIFWRAIGCTLLFGFALILHYWFQNRPPFLVLTCWQRDENLEVFWDHKLWVKLHLKSVLRE